MGPVTIKNLQTQKMRNEIEEMMGVNFALHISRLSAIGAQTRQSGAPKIQLSSNVAKLQGKLEFTWRLFFV